MLPGSLQQGWGLESQSPPRVESDERHEGQPERLLRVCQHGKKTRENTGPLLNSDGALVTMDMEKPAVLNNLPCLSLY